ncbi:hypothetical protein AC482_04780 [miscellaneous Crenarchaeota group-15 archaeon DG-45]|uniref:HTH iclR-type domain-containing protein n=1 Tax=miscellaneous Crenarchaeota group-15 archaeon DG-45 TaxID=1685127 RepID=A0A0M0BNU5_9ARCH|nr:MAG: hypothetical protein AC482_04780 [miscellaneous Crenarchaeota group-15 archaeon DG-45]
MPSAKAIATSVLAIAVLALMAATPPGEAQPSYTPYELVFTVYADGYAAVDYTAVVDPTRARIDIALFGSLYQDLTVEDQDGLPLDYSSADGGLTMDTLGSTSVYVSYVTPDLTAKSAQIWSFSASSPIPCGILLPEGSTIVDLNVVPLEMGILDGSPLLTMPAGAVEVSYTVAFVGTREHALALIRDAEATITAVAARGIAAPEAEALLGKAYEAFEAERYTEAEQHAAQAKASAQSVEAAASSAEGAMNAASASISAARGEGRTEGLDAAEELLQRAEASYEAGDYGGAEALAVQAQAAAKEAKASRLPISWIAVPVAVVAALALFVVVFVLRRGEPAAEDYTGAVDLEGMFERYPHLRFDDREVLRFMADSGGEAFATEIRERFDMPRTSAWRMIRRLQREGIVDVRNVGGQSLVRIRPEHRGKGGGA